jgi:hypothetical protein
MKPRLARLDQTLRRLVRLMAVTNPLLIEVEQCQAHKFRLAVLLHRLSWLWFSCEGMSMRLFALFVITSRDDDARRTRNSALHVMFAQNLVSRPLLNKQHEPILMP